MPHPADPPARVRELDGLRGLAITAVMACHLLGFPRGTAPVAAIDRGLGFATGLGWMGVDLFFVLSGFLITGILADSKGAPGYFRTFYARRTVRILPLYYLYLIVAFHALPLAGRADFHVPGDAPQWPWWAYIGNCWTILGGAAPTMTTHLWSLCIEEQFYLVWPLVVLLCPARAAVAVAVGMVAESVACRTLSVAAGWPAGLPYFFTLARLDGLAIGSLLAIAMRSARGSAAAATLARRYWPVPAAILAGLVAAAQWHHLDVRSYRPGQPLLYTLIATLAGCGLALTVARRPAWLRARPLRFMGQYSYCLYLVHQPVASLLAPVLARPAALRLGGSAVPGVALSAAAVAAASVAVALVSWHAYEKQWLKLKAYFPEPGKRRFVEHVVAAAAADAGPPATARI